MNSSELTYAGLLQWDSLKVASIVVNVVIMFVGPSLLYAVIWYERFSADLMYRTLINQLLSHTCYIQVIISDWFSFETVRLSFGYL